MYFQWINDRIARLTWQDLAVDKIAVICFTILIAKFWPAIMGLEWYWYAVILVVCKAYVGSKFLAK